MTSEYYKLFEDKVFLITGGVGSLGRRLVEELLKPKYSIKAIRVLDINENGIAKLRLQITDSRARWLLGNIVDKERMIRAMEGVDICIATAAQKHVDLAKYNPFFSIQTNVIGTQNCIDAALECNVDRFLYISSDKSCEAVGTYGRCKALSESLTLDANNYKGDKRTKFSIARPPNYLNSDGSMFDVWHYQKSKDLPLTVTQPEATRWFMDFDEIIRFTMKCINLMEGGEIFVPIGAQKHNILELAKQISDNIQIVGLRRGERLHEQLITVEEQIKAQIKEGMWIIKQ